MDRLMRSKIVTFVALATILGVLAVTAPSEARGMGGHGFAGGHHGAAAHPGFDGHHFEGHHFDGHHFDHGIHGRVFLGPVFPFYGYYPYYGYDPAPTYWYYCPSYGAYYPSVTSCPTEWVPVPAS